MSKITTAGPIPTGPINVMAHGPGLAPSAETSLAMIAVNTSRIAAALERLSTADGIVALLRSAIPGLAELDAELDAAKEGRS